ncbi:MAG: RNA methyltransferase [Prolixibacteraceae bacterium]|jgi:TrmH family RNA methyltransferase|nr:RNA methyltransferase [Prolixibacteraceae bacterium]MDI9564868.1 RNA methyltransferase [Bacteroidota bacterium]NLT00859.1 RNA methyltransferase [Bacteroidales bacterium]OQB79430.1 MAG: 23S rRNA (guanosine-2'-O-)-methyltransferase RlmB [Bacteroidetes bacterium ADurb.Bin123]HNU77265.1 RNA methyltransferase [Prolixibacteraceae bacterium]
MLGKNRIKLIKSLEYKKFRNKEKLFVAEGVKLITSLSDSGILIATLIGTPEFFAGAGKEKEAAGEIIIAEEPELAKASYLKTPPPCIALCRIPDYSTEEISPMEELVVCLDDVQDPGNLGTIVRLAGWFGIKDIVCSEQTADIYNPKAVQATMGAIAGVRVHYTSLIRFLEMHKQGNIEVTGTFLEGENIYSARLPANGIVVLGNEGKGISPELFSSITRKIRIPDFSGGPGKPESLNVSMAAAIVLSEFRRRTARA